MRMIHGWAGLRTAAIALAATFAGAMTAQAAPISAKTLITYSTTGNVSSEGVTGAPVVGFNSVATGSFTAPSSFSLGSFQVAPLDDGVTTIYDNVDFSITLGVQLVDGTSPMPNETPLIISGKLNGSVTGKSQSDLVATFNPISYGPFQTGGFLNTLSVLDAAVSLVPSTTNSGQTTAQARIVVTAVPEPGTILIFAAAVGGVAAWRRRRVR